MKNKIAAVVLASLLALGAVACGGGDADDAGSEGTTTTTSEVTS